MRRSRGFVRALVACALWASPARAQSTEARERFEDGVARFDRHDYAGALGAFQRAYELSGRPTVLLNLGVTHQALGHDAEALANLRAYLAARVERSPAQRAAAERAVQELEQRVGHLRLVTDPDGAAVTLDERPPVRDADGDPIVGPGRHTITATLPGYATAREHVTVAPGERRTVRLRLAPDDARGHMAHLTLERVPRAATITVDGEDRMSSGALTLTEGPHALAIRAPGMQPWQGEVDLTGDAPRTLRVSLASSRGGISPAPFWFALGTTGVMTLGAVAMGVLALDAHADFAARDAQDPTLAAVADRGRTLAVATDALGGAALAAGVTTLLLYFQTDFGPRASSAELVVLPAAGGAVAGVSGRF